MGEQQAAYGRFETGRVMGPTGPGGLRGLSDRVEQSHGPCVDPSAAPARTALVRSMSHLRLPSSLLLSLSLLMACGPDSPSLMEPAAEPPVIPTEDAVEAYFLDSYDESRARFLSTAEALEQIYADVEVQSLPVSSATDDDLTIDVVRIPAQREPQGVLIMTLGVHGVEAFAGSGVMQMFVAELLPSIDLETTTVLMVHAVNPWGFRHRRRVSENNVDLNRNLSTSSSLFSTLNAPYADIDDFLHPAEPVTRATVEGALGDALRFALTQPREELQQAILQGQYDHPPGIFYGGAAFEDSREQLDPVFREAVEEHDKVFLMDFHTGFGERGKLHLFGAPGLGTPAAMAAVFEGYEIDTGEGDENFYETDGDMILYVGEIAAEANKTYVGMTMEYGTLDSHTDVGALQSLVNTKLENQGFHHGYADGVEAQIEETFLRSYFPVESEWRREIMTQTHELLPVLVERFIEFE